MLEEKEDERGKYLLGNIYAVYDTFLPAYGRNVCTLAKVRNTVSKHKSKS